MRPTASEFQIIDLNTNIKVQFERLETADFHHGKLFKNRSAFFFMNELCEIRFCVSKHNKKQRERIRMFIPPFFSQYFFEAK